MLSGALKEMVKQWIQDIAQELKEKENIKIKTNLEISKDGD